MHARQKNDAFGVTITHIEQDSRRVIINGLDLVAPAVVFDLHERIGLRKYEPLGWV
jgi:hypothetical protein